MLLHLLQLLQSCAAFAAECQVREVDSERALCRCICIQCQGHTSTAQPCPSLCLGTFAMSVAAGCGSHCEGRFPPNELECTRIYSEHVMTGLAWSKQQREAAEDAKRKSQSAFNVRLVFVAFSAAVFMSALTFYVMRVGGFRFATCMGES